MFYYLSFLRPPPTRAFISSPVSITPQISNDLRTEYYEGNLDIFYSWRREYGSGPSSTTRPVKITTWKGESSAYKEISVPPPPGVRDGDTWSLVLHPSATCPAHIDLALANLGQEPFPVISQPIAFTSRSLPKTKTAQKQEKIQRLYRLGTESTGDGPSANILLRITEQTSFDLDKKIWDSGIGLSSWLVELATRPLLNDDKSQLINRMSDVLFSRKPRNIIELGTGTGIVTLVLSALRSQLNHETESEEQPSRDFLIATDLPSALPLLDHNIACNSLQHRDQTRPIAGVLDWDDESLQGNALLEPLRGSIHAIVMADVTYNTASFPSLIRTLARLKELALAPQHLPADSQGTPSNLGQAPLVCLGYKERDPSERELWDLAKDIGLDLSRVGGRTGARGAAIEVWIGLWKE